MKNRFHIVAAAVFLTTRAWCNPPAPASGELRLGVQAYQEERLKTALGHFIQALQIDPANHEAQTYVKLIAQKLQERQARRAREEEVFILTATSKLLEDRRMDTRPDRSGLATGCSRSNGTRSR